MGFIVAQLGLPGPAVAFAPGNLFWASGACGSPCGVFEITGGGTFGAGALVSGMSNSPGQIAWGEDFETLYITEFGFDRILAISSTGETSSFATQIHGPTGIVRLTDNRILAVSFTDKTVLDVSSGGDLSLAVPFATGFAAPRNLLQLADGSILLADQSLNRVFDITGGGDSSGAPGFAFGLSRGPYDLVQDAFGRIFASTLNGVFEISSGGDFSSATPFATGLNFIGLAIDGEGRLLASDFSSSDVFDISAGGDYTAAIPFAQGMPGFGDTSLDAISVAAQPVAVPALGLSGLACLAFCLAAGGLVATRRRRLT